MPTHSFTETSDAQVAANLKFTETSDAQVGPNLLVTRTSDAFRGADNQVYQSSDAMVGRPSVDLASDATVGKPSVDLASNAMVAADLPPPPPTPQPIPPIMNPFTFPGSFCKNVNDCFPCFVLPTANTSAEAADVLEDFSIAYGNLQTNTPPLGSLFSSNGCIFPCASPVSQTDADLCAARQQAQCVINNWNPPPQQPPTCITPPACAPVSPPLLPPSFPVFGNSTVSCTSHCADGTPFTFTVPPGTFIASTQALADREASSYACREAMLHMVCINLSPSDLCLGVQNPLVFSALGGFLDAEANFWELRSGSLPPGYNFSSTFAGPTLTIQGTPTASGSSTFSMRVTAPNGDFMEKTFNVCVIAIAPSNPTLPNATVGSAYSQFLSVNACAGSNIVWAIADGDLPLGLSLNAATGEISGTPDSSTANQGFIFTIAAQIEA